MKLIDMTCPKCNGTLHVEEGKTQVCCSHCGALLLLDNEVQRVEQHLIYDNAEDAGFEFERGRQRARGMAEYEEAIAALDKRTLRKMEPCESCGLLLANNLKKCPHCGAKHKRKLAAGQIIKLCVIGAIVAFVLWFALSSIHNYKELHVNDTPVIVTASPVE